MKTDDLIAMLGTRVEPVRWRADRSVTVAIAAAALGVCGLVLATMGLRSDLVEWGALLHLMLKVGLMLMLLVPAAVVLRQLALPGGERRVSPTLLGLPLGAVMLLTVASLLLTPASHWSVEIASGGWIECLVSIPVIAIVPFAAIIWTVRRMAPTDLRRAGAASGLIAGCLSALGYALHCSGDTLLFVAVWYGGTMVLCTVAGALLGPHLLRW